MVKTVNYMNKLRPTLEVRKTKQQCIFKQKIILLIMFLTKYSKFKATIVCCGKCGSIKIKYINGKQNKYIYTSTYQCLNCGATASCTEIWK